MLFGGDTPGFLAAAEVGALAGVGFPLAAALAGVAGAFVALVVLFTDDVDPADEAEDRNGVFCGGFAAGGFAVAGVLVLLVLALPAFAAGVLAALVVPGRAGFVPAAGLTAVAACAPRSCCVLFVFTATTARVSSE